MYEAPLLNFLGSGSGNLAELEDEVHEYWDYLLGRTHLPIDNGIMSLLESATAIHVRACEITAQLQEAEYQGSSPKGSNYYKFRTGPLRQLVEASSRAIDLGSRRITVWTNEIELAKEMI
jgi:hypothetical protein